MRTLEKLLELDGKIYIRLDNSETAKRFLRNAEREGFLMQSGKKPTECEPNYFYRVFHDKTIEPSGRGFAGSMYKHTIMNGLVADSFSITIQDTYPERKAISTENEFLFTENS